MNKQLQIGLWLLLIPLPVISTWVLGCSVGSDLLMKLSIAAYAGINAFVWVTLLFQNSLKDAILLISRIVAAIVASSTVWVLLDATPEPLRTKTFYALSTCVMLSFSAFASAMAKDPGQLDKQRMWLQTMRITCVFAALLASRILVDLAWLNKIEIAIFVLYILLIDPRISKINFPRNGTSA